MNDYEIRKVKLDIIALLNSVELPIEVKRLVVADVYKDVSARAEEIISEEAINAKNIQSN